MLRHTPRLLLAIACLCGGWQTALAQPVKSRFGVTQIIAHRGSSADRPENTLAAYKRAIEVGATAVELDVRTTKDLQFVLSHDANLDRTTNGHGPIGQATLAEIKRLDAGSWFDPQFREERVPTLAEALSLCRGKVDVLLDLKEQGDAYDRAVVGQVREHGDAKQVIVGVRSLEQARRFRQLLPDSRQLGLIAKPDEIEAYARAGVETIRLWPQWLADPQSVERVRKAGVRLHINGTSGKPDEVRPLLAHRPDSLSSDDPARLIATLKELEKASQNQP